MQWRSGFQKGWRMFLSTKDSELWLRALRTCPSTDDQFLDWIDGPIKDFFAFVRVFVAVGEHVAGEVRITHSLALGHDEFYLRQIAKTFDLSSRGSLAYWLHNRCPVGIDLIQPPSYASSYELEEIRLFGLGRIAAHGVISHNSNSGTYFSFARIPEPLSQWHMDALTLVAPVLHERFLNYLVATSVNPRDSLDNLTARQRAIVRCVSTGMSDKAVARELGISDKTVRNQLTDIYSRLDVKGRAQLIARLR
jgi:DNA-binding CsgD family transcriptional regulator